MVQFLDMAVNEPNIVQVSNQVLSLLRNHLNPDVHAKLVSKTIKKLYKQQLSSVDDLVAMACTFGDDT